MISPWEMGRIVGKALFFGMLYPDNYPEQLRSGEWGLLGAGLALTPCLNLGNCRYLSFGTYLPSLEPDFEVPIPCEDTGKPTVGEAIENGAHKNEDDTEIERTLDF